MTMTTSPTLGHVCLKSAVDVQYSSKREESECDSRKNNQMKYPV